jgi:hypothetical protein
MIYKYFIKLFQQGFIQQAFTRFLREEFQQKLKLGHTNKKQEVVVHMICFSSSIG